MSRDLRVYDTTQKALRPRPVHSLAAFTMGLIAGIFVGFVCFFMLMTAVLP